ncbi:MAG: hypothetical protein LUH19_01825 [Lachnospiraceae bacterium]|nr:hypothetical protein [Lachnospiraceae bacterium]
MDAYLENTFIAANEKTQYDTYAKNLLSQKDILSHILLATVDEFHGMKPEDVEACIEGEIFVSSVPVDPGLTNAVHAGAGNHIAVLKTATAAGRF